jgi:hypothetical protein
MRRDDEGSIKQYSVAADYTETTPPNVVSSRVVMRLDATLDEDDDAHNFEMEFLRYRPTVTLPNAYSDESTFNVQPQVLAGDALSECVNDPAGSESGSEEGDARDPVEPSYSIRRTNVLEAFESKSERGEWPMDTSVCCYWCCHSFPGQPFGIPTSATEEGGYCVTGCFCSLQCAAAFNMDSRESNEVVCGRHALLSEMSRAAGAGEVSIAPDWRCLRMFGGSMTIEEFRAFSTSGRVMLVNTPPMRSVSTQIEEVNERDVGGGYSFVPLDPVRIERGSNDVTLRRSRRDSDYKNILDYKMRVVVNGE